MSNMSYCRFENTFRDLQDCRDHMDETADLSPEEKKARSWLIDLCMEISDDYGDEPEVEN